MNIKGLKITGLLCLILAVLCFGFYAGGRVERRDRAVAEARSEAVQTIAVVDLDEGILKDGVPIYYADDFLRYPSENFVTTGLEEARQGIYQGRYGAYVIIPASFSRSFASINDIPQKSTLEYAVNPNLDEGIKSEVQSDIQQFQLLLNTNISYVYVSSILEEFHNSQDASRIVLKNDQDELEQISALEAEALLQRLEFSDLLSTDYGMEDLDVDAAFSDSETQLNGMGDGIFANLREGQAEFETIREQNDSFGDASHDLFDLLGAITPGESLSGEIVYEQGLEELERTIDTFHTDIGAKRTIISNRLFDITDDYRTEGSSYLDERVPQLQQETNEQLQLQIAAMQLAVDAALEQIQQENQTIIQQELLVMEQERTDDYEWLQTYIEERLLEIQFELKETYEADANQQLQQILAEVRPATPSTPSEATPAEAWILEEGAYALGTSSEATPSEAYQITLATVSNAAIDLDQSGLIPSLISGRPFSIKQAVSALLEGKNADTDIWIALQAGSILFPDQFIVLPMLNPQIYQALAEELEGLYYISVDAVRAVLQEQVIEEIQKENEVHKTEIELLMDRLEEHMEDYEQSIERFDPYLYVHLDEISSALREISSNIDLIDRAVYEKTGQDREFVNTIYDLIDKNSNELQTDMEKTNEETLKNILQTIELIQTSRTEVNHKNTDLLEDFTRKLSYTRLGSVGNKEAYDFIVNPISMMARETSGQGIFGLNTDLKKYLITGILMLGLTGGGSIYYAAMQVRGKGLRRFFDT